MLSPRQSPRRSPRLLRNTTSLFTDTTGTTASALLMLSPLPIMAAMEATTVATDTMASDLPRLSPRRLPSPTMAITATGDTTASALLTLSPRQSLRRSPRLPRNTTSLFTDTTGTTASAPLMLSLLPTMAAMEATTVATDTMASDLPRRSPRRLPNTTSLFTDTTGTMASAPLMLSLLPSTSMPTLPMDTTMVKAYSTP